MNDLYSNPLKGLDYCTGYMAGIAVMNTGSASANSDAMEIIIL
jgi:hypothetical protein